MADIDRMPSDNRRLPLDRHRWILLTFLWVGVSTPAIMVESSWPAEMSSVFSDEQAPQFLRAVPQSKGAFLGYETAIQTGLERHPLIRKANETAMVAEAVVGQVKSKYYPEFNAYGLATGGTIRPLSAFNIGGAQNKPTSYVQSAGFRGDQLLYDFGQTAHRLESERAGREAAEKDIVTNKAVVILRVQHAYLHCLREKRLVEIAQETVRERGVIRDQIGLLYRRQLKSKLDLDLISVELRNAEVQLLQAKNELRAAFAALNNAMGILGPEEYTLEELPAVALPSDTIEILIQRAMEDRPELQGATNRIRQADEKLSSAQALNFPTISALGVTGVIHFSDAPVNQYLGSHPGQTNFWWGAGAAVSVPLFTGFLIENRVAEAREQKYKSQQKRVDLSNRIALEVTDAFLSLQTMLQQVKIEEREVETARSALTLAKERYRLGLASIVDVTTATTALLAAEVHLSEAQFGAQDSAVALAFAVGASYKKF